MGFTEERLQLRAQLRAAACERHTAGAAIVRIDSPVNPTLLFEMSKEMRRGDGVDRDSSCQPTLIDARRLIDGNEGAEFERAEAGGARHFGYHPKARPGESGAPGVPQPADPAGRGRSVGVPPCQMCASLVVTY